LSRAAGFLLFGPGLVKTIKHTLSILCRDSVPGRMSGKIGEAVARSSNPSLILPPGSMGQRSSLSSTAVLVIGSGKIGGTAVPHNPGEKAIFGLHRLTLGTLNVETSEDCVPCVVGIGASRPSTSRKPRPFLVLRIGRANRLLSSFEATRPFAVVSFLLGLRFRRGR